MKRKICTFLAFVLILAMALPTTVFAASNSATLDKLKLKDVKKYDTALPTKGTKKTAKQINSLLNKLPYKMPGKGETYYDYTLSFSRLVSDKPGTYGDAYAHKWWSKYDSKKKLSSHYSEIRDIRYPKNGTYSNLAKEAKKTWTYYTWKKGGKEGLKTIENKTTGGSGTTVKYSDYKLYSDAKVLGQKCLVYSYYVKQWKETVYLYVSRKTGLTVKQVSVTPEQQYTYIIFDIKWMKKANSFYEVPKKVKFVTSKGDEATNVRRMPTRLDNPLAS